MSMESALTCPNEKRLYQSAIREKRALLSLASPALLFITLIIIVPVTWLFYLSFIGDDGSYSLENYARMVDSKTYARIFLTAFKVSALTTIICILIGYPLAYFLSQLPRRAANLCMLIVLLPFWTSLLVRTYAWLILLISPMMMPIILIAIGIFYVYVQIHMVNTIAGLVLAHMVLALPLVVIIVSSAFKSFDVTLEMVARNLGASRFTAFMAVTLPQIKFVVVTAAILAFLASFDEVIVAMFVSGAENSTLTRNMFNALRVQIDPTIASISIMMILVSSTLLIVVQILGKNRD